MKTVRTAVALLSVVLGLWLLVKWSEHTNEQAGVESDVAAALERGPDGERRRTRTPRRTDEVPGPDEAREAAPVSDELGPAALLATVVDALSETPLADAKVLVHDGPQGTTGEDGTVRLANVGRGLISVRVTAPGYVRSDWVLVDTRTDPAPGDPIPVQLALVRGAALSGTVIDGATGLPVQDATVTAYSGAGSGIFGDPPLGDTETRGDGRFELSGVRRDGTLTLVVKHPGYTDVRHVVAPDAPAPTVELAPAALLTGRVIDGAGRPVAGAKVQAVPTDAHRQWKAALEGAAWLGRAVGAVARTDEEGVFELPGLALDRSWNVVARQDGVGRSEPLLELDPARASPLELVIAPPAVLEVVVAGPQEIQPETVIVRRGSRSLVGRRAEQVGPSLWTFATLPAGSFDLWVEVPGHLPVARSVELPPGATQRVTVRLDAGAAVEGVVVDADGRPIPDVIVSGRGGDARQRTLTDEDGRFRVQGLPPGEVRISASHEWYAIRGARPEAPTDDLELVATRLATAELTLRLPEGLDAVRANAVTGLYRGPPDAEDGHDDPRTGTKRWTRRIVGVDWEDGVATLEHRSLGPGRIRVHAEGFAPVHVDFDLAPGASVDLGDVTLTRGVTLRGRVVDETGRPVPAAQVRVVESAVSNARRVEADDVGAFELPHLAPGELELRASAPGHGGRPTPVQVSETTGLVLVELARLRTLVVRFVDAAGDPVADPTYECTRLEQGRARENHGGRRDPDAPGRVIFELRPGRYRLTSGATTEDLDLTDPEPRELDLTVR